MSSTQPSTGQRDPSTLRRRESNTRALEFVKRQRSGGDTVGLAMSGGGLRGSFFSAGVLESILGRGVRIDHLSSVSGGGFVGSSYMDWKYRNGGKDDPSWHKQYFKHMVSSIVLQFARFETSNFLGWLDVAYRFVAAMWGVGFLAFAAMLAPLFTVIILFTKAVGGHVRSAFMGRTDADTGSLLPRVAAIFLASTALVVLIHAVEERMARSGSIARYALSVALRVATFFTILLTQVTFVHEVRCISDLVTRSCVRHRGEPLAVCDGLGWIIVLAVLAPGALLVSLFRSRSRLKVLSGYTICFSFCIEREIFMDEESKWVTLRWIMVVLSLFHPLLVVYHQNFFFLVYKGFLRRGFFHPDGRLTTWWHERIIPYAEQFSRRRRIGAEGNTCQLSSKRATKENEELKMGDLRGMTPEWICQMTLNRWMYDREDPRDSPHKLLTISTELVDIIDCSTFDMSKYLDVAPEDMRLSTATSLSGALLSLFWGNADDNIFINLRELFILFGFHIDNHLPAWYVDEPTSLPAVYYLCGVMCSLAVPLLIAMGTFLPMFFPDYEPHPLAMPLLTATTMFVFFALSRFPSSESFRKATGMTRVIGNVARMFVTHCMFAMLIRETGTDVTVGKYPDFVLHVCDGGFCENLGLLSLLRRRATKIIVADATAYHKCDRSSELAKVLRYARSWLGCRFRTMTGDDVDEEILRNFGALTEGRSPHTYQFTVEYMDSDGDGDVYVVAEGTILMAQPRHPKDIVPGYWSGPDDVNWSCEYADNQNGLFARRFNGKLPSCLSSVHGVYPEYNAVHIMPTPQMCETLQADGRRAMSSPAAQDFLDTLPSGSAGRPWQRAPSLASLDASSVSRRRTSPQRRHCDDGDDRRMPVCEELDEMNVEA